MESIYYRNECPISDCDVCTPSVADLLSHLAAVHSSDPQFDVVCGIEGCCKRYSIFSSLKSHVYRHHRDHIIRHSDRSSTSRTTAVSAELVSSASCNTSDPAIDRSPASHSNADDHHDLDYFLSHSDADMQYVIDQLLGTDHLVRKRKRVCYVSS